MLDLKYSIQDTIGKITPGKYPGPDDVEHLNEVVDFLAAPNLKGAIIQGQGDHFSCGWIPELQVDEDESSLLKSFAEAISFAPVPVTAVITGTCEGPGLVLALSSHFRFASEDAVIRFDSTKTDESSHILLNEIVKELVSDKNFLEYLISGNNVTAKEAQQNGLIDQIGKTENLDKEAQNFLTTLTEKRSPDLIHTVMRLIQNVKRMEFKKALLEESRLFDAILRNSKNVTFQQ